MIKKHFNTNNKAILKRIDERKDKAVIQPTDAIANTLTKQRELAVPVTRSITKPVNRSWFLDFFNPQFDPFDPLGYTTLSDEEVYNSVYNKIVEETPVRYLINDLLLRMANKRLPKLERNYTEHDFTPAQLEVIDQQVRRVALENGITDKSFSNDSDTIKCWLKAGEYYPKYHGRNYTDHRLPLLYRMFDPVGQVEHILGDYPILFHKRGYTIPNVYDFNRNRGLYKGVEGSYYVDIRRFAGKEGSTDSMPDIFKNHFLINREVNHW